MLSDRDIDKLIKPIIDRQERINIFTIQKIAKRVRVLKKLSPSEVYKTEQTLRTSNDLHDISEEIAKMTDLNRKDITRVLQIVAQDTYADAKHLFKKQNVQYSSFFDNETVQKILKAITALTIAEFLKRMSVLVFMLRDPISPRIRKPMTIESTYKSVVNEAIQATMSGLDYNTVLATTLQQLADSSVRTLLTTVTSHGLLSTTMDVYMRRLLLTAIRDLNQQLQDALGKQFGADGKEISVHEMSAPDHEPVQGHQFTNEEYEKLQSEQMFADVQGNIFAPIERAIGEYNCRHFTYAILVGYSKPRYTQEQLDANIARNQEGYTDSTGKHRTLYECTQEQRRMERAIRQAKRTIITGRASDNSVLITRGNASLYRYESAYKAFSKACGIATEPDNCYVVGY